MARVVLPGHNDSEFRRRYPPEAIAAMMSADRTYIEASFAAIERKHGSVASFLRDDLGLDESTLGRLRTRPLEPIAKSSLAHLGA